jgi:hypothetical protein
MQLSTIELDLGVLALDAEADIAGEAKAQHA